MRESGRSGMFQVGVMRTFMLSNSSPLLIVHVAGTTSTIRTDSFGILMVGIEEELEDALSLTIGSTAASTSFTEFSSSYVTIIGLSDL